MRHHKGYKFRIYPTPAQEQFFAKAFGCNRFVWNYFLNERKEFYLGIQEREKSGVKEKKRGLNYCDNAKSLTALKKEAATSWLKGVNAQSLQQELKHLDAAYLNFFRKTAGFPKFKSKGGKQSFVVPQQFYLEEQGLRLPKLDAHVRIVKHREFGINPKICKVVVSKTKTGKYYASFLVEEDIKPSFKLETKVGIDLGLKSFIAFSDGTKIQPNGIAKSKRNKIEYLGRQISKKVKGGKNRERARLKLARVHENISNVKRDFLHKTSRRIVDENQVIAAETLNVAGMVKNRRLARSISEVNWGEFVRQLEYKSAWAGRSFVKIGQFFPSSKTCSSCGWINQSLTLKDREWQCRCGVKHDRDVNAAKNILRQGENLINSGVGLTSESKQKLGEALTIGKAKALRKSRVVEPRVSEARF